MFAIISGSPTKKIFPATFRCNFFASFFARISLFCQLHTHGFITSHAFIASLYCRDILLIRRRKSRRKGPERERERESLGESYVVHRHHRHPFSSSRAKKKEHIFEFAVKNSKRRFDVTRHENPSSSKNHRDVLCFCARQRRL